MVFTELIQRTLESISEQISHIHTGEAIIFDIAVILIISAVLAFIARVLRQPLIPAYVITGVIIGPLFLSLIGQPELISAFSEIGIAFLLFTAGLEISFRKIKEANIRKILLIGVLQVGIIFAISYFLGGYFNLTPLQAAYIGIILSFGSTMVDIKLLSDTGKIVTLHGRIVIGILLLQDLVAIIAIMIFTSGGSAFMPVFYSFLKLFAIVIFSIFLQKFILNKTFRFAASSTELLFLFSLAILFLFIMLSYVSGISIVIGAFIAGVSLANSPFKTELESRIYPLRDFFAILFFVALGMQVVFVGIENRLPLLIALLIGAMILKPLITFILLRTTGYRPRTSFLTSTSLAQLSEFSLIIGMLGVSLGAISPPIFSTVILATIITMSLTPYFIQYGERTYKLFRHPINLFKFLPIKENLGYDHEGKKEVLLIGAHRMGALLLKELLRKKSKLVVIDYNPEIISPLIKKKVACIYGDITSPELLHKVKIKNLKMAVSTVPGFEENLYILNEIKKANPKVKVILTGSRISETLKLYEAGADYVITPKVIAGIKIARILHSETPRLKRLKQKHLRRLNNIHKLLY